jgi:hypothetical protein
VTPAILLSLVTILLWSSLAGLSAGLNHLPAFLVAGIALVIGGLVGLFRIRDFRVPGWTFALGVVGIFGYHALCCSTSGRCSSCCSRPCT